MFNQKDPNIELTREHAGEALKVFNNYNQVLKPMANCGCPDTMSTDTVQLNAFLIEAEPEEKRSCVQRHIESLLPINSDIPCKRKFGSTETINVSNSVLKGHKCISFESINFTVNFYFAVNNHFRWTTNFRTKMDLWPFTTSRLNYVHNMSLAKKFAIKLIVNDENSWLMDRRSNNTVIKWKHFLLVKHLFYSLAIRQGERTKI